MLTAMRPFLALLIAGLGWAADDVTIARLGRHLVVTAPVTGSTDPGVERLLEQRVSAHFQGATLDEVATFIRTNTSLNVIVAPTVIAAPVTIQVRDMSLRFLIDWTCTVARVRCTWLDGALYFTDQATIAGRTATRMFDISDLVMPVQDFPGPELGLHSNQGQGGVQVLPPVAPARQPPTVDDIEALIRRVVAPAAR